MSALRRLLPILILITVPLAAQTTGSISGHVTDASGATLPGVTVEATSAALQGSRVGVSDAAGLYRLPLLPPGNYTVAFTLSGFGQKKQAAVAVLLGKETAVDAVLSPAVTESITVGSFAPPIDTSSNTLGTNLNAAQIETLPTARNYSSVAQITPGVSTDAIQADNKQTPTITVYGSSGAENAFFVDGVNTTGLEYGFQGKELNFEFIQALEVKTGGYEAEYGRVTGGIINVITKSGSNEFHGDVFGYDDSDSLQTSSNRVFRTDAGRLHAEGLRRRHRRLHSQRQAVVLRRLRPGAQHAGQSPARRTARRPRRHLPEPPQPRLREADLQHHAQPHASSLPFCRIRASTRARSTTPTTRSSATRRLPRPQDFGGRDYALRYDGIAGTSWLFSAQGRAPRGEKLGRSGHRRRRRHRVHRRRATISSKAAASV